MRWLVLMPSVALLGLTLLGVSEAVGGLANVTSFPAEGRLPATSVKDASDEERHYSNFDMEERDKRDKRDERGEKEDTEQTEETEEIVEQEALKEARDEDKAETSKEAAHAFEVLVLVLLVMVALCAGRLLHHNHVFWLPESGATILIGFATGLLVHAISPAESTTERNFYFDPEFFSLFLLPPIIFESGFTLNQRLFFANFGAILTFAVLGTLISTTLMWALVYKLGQLGYIFELSMVESGAFASLISAVDPVATLATFSSLKADPRLHNLVFGESVLNDAVAIVLFRSILSFYFDEFYASLHLPIVVLSFISTAVVSACIGVGVAIVAALSFKALRMAHEEGEAAVTECALFWAVSFLSYLVAMVLELSGIVSSLFCGVFMARYVTPNLSQPALALTADALRVLALVADTMVFMLVGMAIPIYTSENITLVPFFLVAFLGCIVTRALNIFPLAFLLNCVRKHEKKISCRFQMVMWFSGLRGAIAVALSVQMPGPHKGPIVVVTMLVVVTSIFLLGGGSKSLLDRLEIQTGKAAPIDRELSELTVSHRHMNLVAGTASKGEEDRNVFSRCKQFGIHMRHLEQQFILARVVDRTIPGHEDAWERKNQLWERRPKVVSPRHRPSSECVSGSDEPSSSATPATTVVASHAEELSDDETDARSGMLSPGRRG